MDRDRRRVLIEQYREGPAVVMDGEDWDRAGTHTDSGAYSVEQWLEIDADHGVAHADQIVRARSA